MKRSGGQAGPWRPWWLRSGFGPVAGAAESYQQLIMSREPTSELIQHAFPDAMDETTASEPPQPRA
ncbi:hypothetical protein JOF48_003491 [Arthrobacter stackebrandtii]|uniref:Uncharacterized protein n=1 Tax=Arthrobacter stackebrandtii TaxID=272161 RepID=A0ABS4Z0W3_9MICC|nr:hypothetical protein [Arthrobacter stackebrandtii]MBP2414692.1 hypothetical protein [Arthrobacter stackebrandtii]PYH01783.1 hypothetical protein CVV67_04845 [Arthrobacter stackebrandtii]